MTRRLPLLAAAILATTAFVTLGAAPAGAAPGAPTYSPVLVPYLTTHADPVDDQLDLNQPESTPTGEPDDITGLTLKHGRAVSTVTVQFTKVVRRPLSKFTVTLASPDRSVRVVYTNDTANGRFVQRTRVRGAGITTTLDVVKDRLVVRIPNRALGDADQFRAMATAEVSPSRYTLVDDTDWTTWALRRG